MPASSVSQSAWTKPPLSFSPTELLLDSDGSLPRRQAPPKAVGSLSWNRVSALK
jgi:hypothetical protein